MVASLSPNLGVFLMLHLVALGIASPPSNCPPNLHANCTCESYEYTAYIDCGNTHVSDVLASLRGETFEILNIYGRPPDKFGGRPITHFQLDESPTLIKMSLNFTNCSLPVLDEIPIKGLRAIQIDNCGITTIKNNAFSTFAYSLEELLLSHNNLTAIPPLGYLPKLKRLNLRFNQIADIPEGSLNGLPSLSDLTVSSNQICALSKNSLADAKGTLQHLALAANCLSEVPADALRNCKQLQYLYLGGNEITEIRDFDLELPELLTLWITHNKISRIQPMAFMDMPKLDALFIKNNMLTHLEKNHLQGFKQLEIFDATNNSLNEIPTFANLTNLRQIRLGGNMITKVQPHTFVGFPKLTHIFLDNNAISSIARDSFGSLPDLQFLYLNNYSKKSPGNSMFCKENADWLRNWAKKTRINMMWDCKTHPR